MFGDFFLVALGAVFGWFVNSQSSKVSENANVLNDHIKDVEVFSDILLDYWLEESADLKAEKVRATRVLAQHSKIAQFYGEAERRLPLGHLRDYQVLSSRLYKIGTGGAFDTADRTTEPGTAIECVDLAAQMVQLLRVGRQQQLSLVWQMKSALTPRYRSRTRHD